nr:Asparaginase glutaminase [Hymenolepis microstoma]
MCANSPDEDLLSYFSTVPSVESFQSTPALIEAALSDPTCSSVGTVLVLYTGGTIGMCSHGGVYGPEPNFLVKKVMSMSMFCDQSFVERNKIHVDYYKSKQSDGAVGDSSGDCQWPLICMPPTVENRRIFFMIAEYKDLLDSSNCTIENWILVSKHIKYFYDKFDGFIVLHGTDTLAYGASFLSFILEGLCKPVIVTGSQIPIGELRSDGRENFLGSLLIAGGDQIIPEVTVFFNNNLLRGNRSVKCSATDFDAFTSPNYPPLARIGIDIKFHLSNIRRCPGEGRSLHVIESLSRNVAMLRMFPSISAKTVENFFKVPIEGVILQTYGAGNVPSTRRDILEIFSKATSEGIVILNITQCWHGSVEAKYSTGKVLESVGVIPGYDMTPEAALAKLSYVLGVSNDIKVRRRMLRCDLRGEVTLPPAREVNVAQPPNFSLQGVSSGYEGINQLVGHVGYIFAKATVEGSGNLWAQRILPNLLCGAAEANDCYMLEQLYTVTHSFDVPDRETRLPLHIAAANGNYDACELMLKKGANPNLTDRSRLTALSHAIRGSKANKELIDLLVEHGALIYNSESLRARETNQAAMHGQVDQLRLYKHFGLTLQELDSEGRAPLHTAVCNRQLEVIRYLISPESEGGANVDVNQKTAYGKTACDEARTRKLSEIVSMLQKVSA